VTEDTFGRFARFPSTRWSVVQRAGEKSEDTWRDALNSLLARYIPAMKAHLVAKWRLSLDRAEDMLQDFVSDKILQQDLIARADKERGRFRNLLLKSLHNYVVSTIRRAGAEKRIPDGSSMKSMDENVDQVATGQQPGEVFDVAWAREVIAETLRRMESHCKESNRLSLWEAFECRVSGPILEQVEPPPYEEMVERFGFQSPMQAANTVLTGKRMFARILRSVIGEYSRDDEEAESEIADLRRILSGSGAKSNSQVRSDW